MRAEKIQLVQDIKTLLETSPSFFLVNYKGLTAKAFAELRSLLASVGGQCHVMPNRIFRKASEELGLELHKETAFVDDNALVLSGEDVVAVAKILRDFAKTHEELAVKLGVLNGQLCSSEDVTALAALPAREVLLAQLLSVLEAPASQLVRVMNAKLASIVYVLSAYLNEKEKAA
ncbi:MAG: 50S ribosomal protein L10 [Desulfobacteraceae bacterium]|nr:50S ribosomal protein L10 [Desulfobacteraceae bacterium]